MVKVMLCGCNGRMGRAVHNIIASEKNMEIVAGVDLFQKVDNPYPVYDSVNDVDVPCDVIIDFSSSKTTDELLDFCLQSGIPVVLCSTGLSDEQIAKVEEASKNVAILRSGNMSLGVNLIVKMLGEMSKVLTDAGFDVEVVEKHHKMKMDAPSGTALMLADAVNGANENKFEYVYDRTERREVRPVNEIGISAVRGGSIVGDHDVIFAGQDEVVTISHRAYSRALFAKGAVSAAYFLADKKAGLYTMQDVIG
ncbi:MAG: 4-hydroxy-tetrahydrodipicolinate reductase [Lachnospiraceae bacterium]|nr:4-hydroxy-tetrahydrodipicolinate reductase [Lachnospiraceae bacterium]